MRHTGIPTIGDVPWGTHLCQFYQEKRDLVDILVPYFKAGLENNEFCMWVTSEPLRAEEARAALATVVEDLEDYIRKGQIEILDYREWYTAGGKFESDRVLRGWVERLDSAVNRGFDGLRLTRNAFWLGKADWQDFTECEAAVDSVIGQSRMLAICTYSLAKCGAIEIMDVVSNHAFALIKRSGRWQIFESVERKKVEASLRQSEDRLQMAIDSTDLGTWDFDPQSGKLIWSDLCKRHFGLPPGVEVDYDTFLRGLHADDRERVHETVQHALRPGSSGQFSVEYRTVGIEDAEERWIAAKGRAYFNSEGRCVRFIGTTFEVTERKRAEEAFRDSEAQFRTLANAIPQLCWMANADGWIFWYNGRWYEYTGTTTAQMEGWGWQSVHDPEMLPKVLQRWKGSIATGEPFDMVFPLRGADGVFRPFLTRVMPVFDRDGKVARWFGTNTDISEQRKTEEALRESEKLLVADLDAMTRLQKLGTLFVREGELEPVLCEIVDAAIAISGADFGDIQLLDPKSSNLKIVAQRGFPQWWLNFWAEVSEARASCGAALERGERVIVEDVEKSPIFAGTPGLEMQLKAGVRAVQSTPLVSRSGKLLGMFSTHYKAPHRPGDHTLRLLDLLARHAADIIARVQAEEEVAASEARLGALLESASQGVVAVDESGRIVLVNAKTEEMFGYTRDDLLGQPLEMLLPERYRKVHAQHMRLYFESPHTRAMGLGLDLQGCSKDGNEFPLEVSLSCINQSGSRLAMALMTDITERKKAEERLWQAQKLESIGLLAGGVAHDFNNLLVGVVGNASLAREMLPQDHDAAELLQSVISTGERLAHLTRQMLAYSGKGRFVVEPLDLSLLIPEMSSLVQPSIPKKITLQFELEPRLPLVEADRGQMQQVFMNLVLNGAEAIGNNAGMISVKTGLQVIDESYIRRNPEAVELHPGKYVGLEVRDTGCGMDEATKKRIFDPFFSTKFTGRGLGLAAVAGIVRGHKGAIKVTSAPGKGTCFTVLFRAAEGSVGVSRPMSRETVLQGEGTVLVVDDEETVRELAKKSLERCGYRTLVAYSGLSAIDIFKRHPGEISLVLLDLSMPEMGGEEVLPELRRIRPEVKVVVSSGYSEGETMTLFSGQRVSGFIQKPYTSTALAKKVKMALA